MIETTASSPPTRSPTSGNDPELHMSTQTETIDSGWQRLKKRFGVAQPMLLIGSTIGIFLIMGAFISLWTSGFHNDPNSLRSIIARRNQTNSTITACCAVLRVLMAVQIGTCCMMLATLAFEKGCVLLRDAAAVSMYRYAAGSPWALAIPVFRGTKVSKNIATIMMVLLLSIVTILSQLLSTVLLRDLGTRSILGPLRNIQVFIWTGPSDLFRPLSDPPQAFPRFAETLGNNFTRSDSPTGPGLSGTGKTMRAYFPLLESSQRSTLINYNGTAGLMEAHVLCMSPEVKSITFGGPDRVSGKLSIDFSRQLLESRDLDSFRWNDAQPASEIIFNFDCTISTLAQGFALCPLRSPETHNCPGFPTSCLFTETNTWLLVLHLDMIDEPEILPELYNVTGYEFKGTEWTSNSVYSSTSDYENVSKMTLCVAGTKNTVTTVAAKANEPADEPEYGTFLNNTFIISGDPNNTDKIRKQLNPGGDFQNRGILNLTAHAYKEEEYYNFSNAVADIAKPAVAEFLSGTPFYNASLFTWDFADVYAEIFVFMLEDTGIAFALQAIFSTVTAQAFYGQVATEDDMKFVEHLNTSLLQTAPKLVVPTEKRGLFILCGLVGVHLVAVAIVFCMFFTSPGPKFLDQAWRTLAQLHTGATTGEFLRTHGDRSDIDIAQDLEARNVVVKLWTNDVDSDGHSSSTHGDPGSIQITNKQKDGQKEGSQDQANPSDVVSSIV